MTALPGCPRCRRTLTECARCGSEMRQGVCQITLDPQGRPVADEDYYCPRGCDATPAYAASVKQWLAEHRCEALP